MDSDGRVKQEWCELVSDDFLFLERIPFSWVRASVEVYRENSEKFALGYLLKRKMGQ